MKMMHGTVPRTDTQFIASNNGIMKIRVGLADGIRQIQSLRQACGNGRRQRTPGAVGIGGRYSFRFEANHFP